MKKGDLIILGLALVLAAAPLTLFLTPAAPPARAVVRINGGVVRALPLETDALISFDECGYNRVRVRGGAVFIEEADCPDGACMRMGPIRHTGETITCLPNRLTVTIEGAAQGVDAVTR